MGRKQLAGASVRETESLFVELISLKPSNFRTPACFRNAELRTHETIRSLGERTPQHARLESDASSRNTQTGPDCFRPNSVSFVKSEQCLFNGSEKAQESARGSVTASEADDS